MAVTIVDLRTAPTNSDADATTGFSSPVAGESITLITSVPSPVEPTGSLGMVVSTQTSEIILTISSTDFSDILVYVWILTTADVDSQANGGITLVLDDGTDGVAYHVAGNDKAVFRHSDGPVQWQCLVIDTSNLPSGTTLVRGVEVNLTFTAITAVGAQFKTLSKAVGNIDNCFIDQIRYGNSGIAVRGGTTGARGTFEEIAIDDRSETSAKAWGAVRQLGSGVFGVQTPLEFGEPASNADHYFQDTNVTVIFEDTGIDAAKYGITLRGNSTDTGHFQLGTISGTEEGVDGCTLLSDTTGGGGFLDFSDVDFDTLNLYGCVFQNFSGPVDFSDDATNGINHDVFSTLFDLCGQINPGRVAMKNCTISNSTNASAMLLDDSDNTLLENNSFISDGTGHAIELTPTGAGPHSFAFVGHKFSGYAGSDGSTGNEVVLYNPVTSSADCTITITQDGDTPTIMLAGGVTGTVTLVNNKTVTFTGMLDNTEVRIYDSGDGSAIDGIENATAGTTDDRSFAWQDLGGNVVDYVIHNVIRAKTIRVNGFTVPSTDTSIPIQQQLERGSYTNP